MKYRSRKQATEYLRENGIPCRDGFLAHLAVTGEGPQFCYSGRHPICTEGDLDTWIEARLSAPVRSPSEATVATLNTAAMPSESESENQKQSSDPPLGPPTRTARPHQHRASGPKLKAKGSPEPGSRRPGRPRLKNKVIEPDLFEPDARAP